MGHFAFGGVSTCLLVSPAESQFYRKLKELKQKAIVMLEPQLSAISPEIIQQVNALMKTGFELPEEKLVPEATLAADLGLDSLDAVDMLIYIEETLGVKVEGERLTTVKTLNDVYILAMDSLRAQTEATRPVEVHPSTSN